jgi:hypothetical protein
MIIGKWEKVWMDSRIDGYLTEIPCLLVILLASILSGCTTIGKTDVFTPIPTEYVPTAIALTVAAADLSTSLAYQSPTSTLPETPMPSLQPSTPDRAGSPSPSLTAKVNFGRGTQSPTPGKATVTPTPSPTPGIPFAEIQILSPGPASKIISPIKLNAFLLPGARGHVRVELLGEDGRLLVRKILSYYPGIRIHTNIELEFETPAVAEAGRLQIITEDGYGRTVSLASVDLLLLSMGEEDLNPPGDLLEEIVINEPVENSLIQGGNLMVSGLARTSGVNPLIVEMFTKDNKQVGPTRLVLVTPSPDGKHVQFTAEVPYSVSSPTWVRLEVYEQEGRIPGKTHLSSIEVLLSP